MLQNELLVMVLSPLSMRDLSRALSMSKHSNRAILESAELRRTLFLEPEQAREFLATQQGTDQRCYKHPDEWQPVIVHEPFVLHEKRRTRKIVKQHPILLGGIKAISGSGVTLPDFSVVKTVPAMAFLFQPPVNEITIEHWGHSTRVQDSGGVTFGATLKAVEKIRATVKKRIAQSPRFAGYQYGLQDQLALSISELFDGAIFNDSYRVEIARRALKKAKEFAVLDELEGKST